MRPSSVASTADGAAYVSDAGSCRLRRVAPTVSFASAAVTCDTTLTEVLRPSGCSSYEPPQGEDGLTASPVSGNVWYNHWRNVNEGSGSASEGVDVAAETDNNGDYLYAEDPEHVAGRVIRQCVGFPPPYRLDRAIDPFDALVVDDGLEVASEDTGRRTTVRISCPTSCVAAVERGHAKGKVRGSPDFYTDDSSVCMAAVHAGVLSNASAASPAPVQPSVSTRGSSSSSESEDPDMVVVVIARLLLGNTSEAAASTLPSYSSANGVLAEGAPRDMERGFALEMALPSEVTTQTIAGRPAGALGEGCGEPVDGQPPQEAVFGRLAGIDAWHTSNLTDQV